MSTDIRSGAAAVSGGAGVSAWKSARRTLGLIAFGWAAAVGNTLLAYLTSGTDAIPIIVGVVLCFVFVMLLVFLHRAWWLGVLALVPALFVLVGSVQYPPEGALDLRGVREPVVVVADSAAGTSSNNHQLTLKNTETGRELAEKLTYRGQAGAPEVGERLDIIRDPDGRVPMEEADSVDASEELRNLVGGAAVWTLMALLAGRRGHVRRRRGRELRDLPTW
ncbi:hypothetical protein H9Y04_20250 [Streptomyces sp. TRM66268-LWL]|uniref:Integral membrane protein n=1 Tax=Streptomyces polyasparticus TaxID=2767826 RepID=A0ABR7SKM4_9ACTN|nr:hypothetical protein [Streptomyces polyasparticus]MBC9714883.1 hypothetical protein [Streptomyces polyasparticus]